MNGAQHTTVKLQDPVAASAGKPAIPRLAGRQRECEVLDELVGNLWTGESQVLVLRGAEGVGKTALLDHLAEQAVGCRVVRAAGIESERGLAYAGLHQLCAPVLAGLDGLPAPQHDVLCTVFGLCGGDVPDRFVVGMAVMGLLTTAAADRPLLCIVNDLQWFDEASFQILGFVTRRLTDEPIAIVMALENDDCIGDLTGVPELLVDGLADEDARSLLRTAVVGPLDIRVEERIAAEARGNPKALRQVATGAVDELAGGYGLPRVALPVGEQARFRNRLAALSPVTRQLILLAAAEPTGDAVLLWSAANELGITADAALAAAAAGLVEFDDRVRFCHPFLRAFVYDSASPRDRRTAHCALAAATDPDADPASRAWHRAQGAAGVDEEAAVDLERAAARARDRGGLPAFAAFLARSAELTADPECRAKRALVAAEAKSEAGFRGAARRMLAMAQAGPLGGPHHVRAQVLAARLAADTRRGADTTRLLLEAAEGLEPDLARRAHGDAFIASRIAGRLCSLAASEVALVARSASSGGHFDGPGLLLDGLATMASDGPGAAAPQIRSALEALQDRESDDEDAFWWLPLACRAALETWDERTWRALASRLIRNARRAGALGVLPDALNSGSVIQLLTAGCDAARPMTLEVEAVGRATGTAVAPTGRLLMVAWQGALPDVSRVAAETTTRLMARGEGSWLTVAGLASAVANNSLGRYHDALAAAEHGSEFPEEWGYAPWCQVELIEAAARVGDTERAARGLKQLLISTDAADTDWAHGVAARARALVIDGEAAEREYLTAIVKLDHSDVHADLGRAQLLYGEWLRRQGRRLDAREQLRSAHELFLRLGFDGFAERARRELVATGGTPRRRTPSTANVLTPQEAQIARMARDGHSNSEIGGELYISHRTVEWHLRKVFMKLGISSRRQLDKALPT